MKNQEKYEKIKSKFITYIDGYSRGNNQVRDKVKLFFEYINSMIKEFDIEKYKILKLELWQYLDGFSKGNWGMKDNLRNFFKTIDEILIGDSEEFLEKVNLNSYSLL